MYKIITIKYCEPCGFKAKAEYLAEAIKAQFGEKQTRIVLEPTKLIGSFEISLDDDLIYSKNKTGRLPHPGEVEQILMTRIFI